MTKATGRVFRSGNSEAIRLHKDVAFGEELDVTVIRSGEVLTIYPTRPSIQDMLRQLDELPGPGEIEVRDGDIFPYRPGLED